MISCPAGNDGIAISTPTGGNAPYNYTWSTGSVDSMITNLSPGTYTVTVVDFFNCSFIETYEITEPAPIEANSTAVNASCGMLNGIAYVDPTGGTAPYTFEWFNGSTADSLANLEAGTYAVNITDANNCVNQFSVQITMENMPPTAIAQTDLSFPLDAQGVAFIDVNLVNNGSFDDCGIDTMYIDFDVFTCDQIGENVVTLTVVDNQGLMTSMTTIVTIFDVEQPTVMTQNITIPLNVNGTATITPAQVDNGSFDNCMIEVMTLSMSQFDCSNLGENTVILTVMDIYENIDSAAAVVTIVDELTPNIITQNVAVALDANGNAAITPSQVNNGLFDNCAIDSASISMSQFDCTNIGSNTVMLTAMDASGNSTTEPVIITIVDDMAPTIATQNITVVLDTNGVAQISVSQIDNGTSDNCGIDTMNLDISTFDCTNLGDNTVLLTATDVNGNVNEAEATVTVVDDLAPTIIVQNIAVYLDENGNAEVNMDQINNGTFDNCEINSMSIDITSFDCDNLGGNDVIFTAIDANGNMAFDTAIVTVTDTIAATILCPPNLVIESCDSVIILDYMLGDVIDNCSTGSPVIVSGIPSGEELSTGTVTNVFEYIDPAGNISTCSFDITLVTVPEIVIQLDSSTPATAGNSDGSIEITITTGTGPFQFEWISGGSVVSTDEDPTGLPAGNYEVLVTGVNGCAATFQVDIMTGVQDPELVAKVNLFPNPTSDILFVKMDLPIESGDKVQLYSIDGKVLLEKTLAAGEALIELNVENFNNGIYIMQLTVNQGVVTKRVIVE